MFVCLVCLLHVLFLRGWCIPVITYFTHHPTDCGLSACVVSTWLPSSGGGWTAEALPYTDWAMITKSSPRQSEIWEGGGWWNMLCVCVWVVWVCVCVVVVMACVCVGAGGVTRTGVLRMTSCSLNPSNTKSAASSIESSPRTRKCLNIPVRAISVTVMVSYKDAEYCAGTLDHCIFSH